MNDPNTSTNQVETESPAAPVAAGARNSATMPAGVRSWARDILLLFVLAVLLLVLYQPVRVEGTSMLPMLEDQDRLFINKFAYHFAEIHRGDVVVFRYPHDTTKSYIKRVIALPGDELRIDHGAVWCERAGVERELRAGAVSG